MPRVLNKYKDKIPPDAVCIMRPYKYGNPFIITKVEHRERVIQAYEEYITDKIVRGELTLNEIREDLAGRDLVCCCKPKPCHGDYLLKLANTL